MESQIKFFGGFKKWFFLRALSLADDPEKPPGL